MKNNQWDPLLGEYTNSLENRKSLFEQIQDASNDMVSKFNSEWDEWKC